MNVYGNVFGGIAIAAAVSAFILFALSPWLKARMHLSEAEAAGHGSH